MHPIRLSEKAWNFVESRRGDLLHDEYVSRLIENVADLSGEGSIMTDGLRVIEAIEAYRPGYSSADSGYDKVAGEVIGYLREAFHGKVPRAMFSKKCEERGLEKEEIAKAELQFNEWLD
jgi:hypothetical protein